MQNNNVETASIENMQNQPTVAKKRRKKIYLFDIFNYVFLTILGLICLFPVLYEALMSFSSRSDFMSAKFIVIPNEFNIEHYKHIFGQGRVGTAFLISLLVTVVGTLYSLILTSFGAYAFTRKNVPGIRICFTLVIITMFFSGGLIPFYLTVSRIFGMNNLIVLIIPFGINSFNMIILRNFFVQVPDSLLESARIDGASEFRLLFQFVIPLSKAGIATVALWYIVGKWDDWYWPSLFLSRADHLYPLALELRNTLMKMDGSNPVDPDMDLQGKLIHSDGLNAAIIMTSITPILILYPFLQKYFVKGVMIGSVKE